MPLLVRTGLAIAVMSGVAACVTINIYFPAAAAEKAADKIIDEVWQASPPEKKEAVPDRGGEK
ncbi:hypothetical protein GPA19_05005 [Azoarcus indigens]|uniref:Uncharacterized protein n=1 Tax=Azoarcus indigens TaxID=29545 RepID=A0A4R6DWR9_9RHOO|nr:hypothetical protein [Azoarcus indigens]NMG64305.1 hypothetical protein [Azoarcus indigens]TDN49244.1 hypothetical protein C7389_11299 [Azoarcus indigens]